MLRELITEKEYKMLDCWRSYYGLEGRSHNPIPMRDYLGVWEDKKRDLFNLFGEKLMVSKEIEYVEDFGSLIEQFWDILREYKVLDYYGDLKRKVVSYIKTTDQVAATLLDNIYNFFHSNTFVNNKYEGSTFEMPLPNGNILKVSNGCKPMRVVKKLAEAVEFTEDFENFRLAHSMLLNKKTVKGNLVLSIHPLDFWTMSDNDCDWGSCMSWTDDGCYRRGTIATMHAENVIVAYIEAKEPYMIKGEPWSNKKWRQLFIVEPNMIGSIKAYPYENIGLTELIMKWIKELAEANNHWTYEEKFYSKLLIDEGTKNISNPLSLEFCCDPMYCDMGTTEHRFYLSDTLSKEDLSYNSYRDHYRLLINYGGVTPCLCCGEIGESFSSEENLCCESCNGICCNECGEYIYPEDIIWVDDSCTPVCSSCYKKYYRRCLNCGNAVHICNDHQVYIMPRITEDNIGKIKERFPNFDAENSLFRNSSYKGNLIRFHFCWLGCKGCDGEMLKDGEEFHERGSTYFIEQCAYLDQILPELVPEGLTNEKYLELLLNDSDISI